MLLLLLAGAGGAQRPAGHPGRRPLTPQQERARARKRAQDAALAQDATLLEDEELVLLLMARPRSL